MNNINKDQIIEDAVNLVKKVHNEEREKTKLIIKTNEQNLLKINENLNSLNSNMEEELNEFIEVTKKLNDKQLSELSFQEKELIDKANKAESIINLNNTAIRIEKSFKEQETNVQYVLNKINIIEKKVNLIEEVLEISKQRFLTEKETLRKIEIIEERITRNNLILEEQERRIKKSFFAKLFGK
jgi:hypothetical protein